MSPRTSVPTSHLPVPAATAAPPPTVRELIGELARLGDRIREVATFTPVEGRTAAVSPELVELARREGQVVAELRRRRSGR